MSESPGLPPSPPENGGAVAPAAPPPASVGRGLLYAAGAVSVVLVLLLAVVFVWHRVTVRRMEAKAVAERSETTAARQQALATQGREILRLAGLPLGWAVRAEVLKDNLQQVDDYFRRFVREPGVQSLLYVDAAGRVAVATDRKLEGQPAGGLVSATLLDATELTFEEKSPGIRLAVPIMAFDARAGVLILDYAMRDPEVPAPPAPASAPTAPAGN